jgi:DNA helicase-2/ATP-dependent DNA helicase PcrA
VGRPAPDELLADLNTAQREAATAATGPVAILAGAGTGKTRVLSRRAAYAIATGVVPPDQVLIVTFTDKAATEMVDRLKVLGLPGVTARTFHAHALQQLRYFWPRLHHGEPLPDLLESKIPLLVPIARGLPGHYRFTAAKDLADEIEWAKIRRVQPAAYERAATSRTPPIPADLMARVYGAYERAKTRARRLDFEDLLARTVDLLEEDVDALEFVRTRKRWFSVDEYQDTNPLQERLLELWRGESPDVCVVGDEDQTIYTFTGATSDYLATFADRYPRARVVQLTENYRSTPDILEVANRLLAGQGRTKGLTATLSSGPRPAVHYHATGDAELEALVSGVRALVRSGTPPAEIAVLVRMNAQVAPIEDALTRAGVPYRVRGIRFYDRPEVRGAVDVLRRAAPEATGPALVGAVTALWRRSLGYGEAADGPEARERTASLDTIVDILVDLARDRPDLDGEAFLAELRRRAADERAGEADGVNLLTYHRAKGLEWDAVFLPMLEEGSLPIRQALDDEAALAEEGRLLYVGITRARRHLALSWAGLREVRGRDSRRERSRFLWDLSPRPAGRVVEIPPAGLQPAARARLLADDPLVAALREWRLARARADDVPAFVIAHDTVLAAIAEARPASLAGLRGVKGMGPAKLERYGDEILAVIARASVPA